ncbi:MAG: hypothetical protein KME28_08095 [Pelatocladus maniniholoensis HA4357-MV3]|jgi:hypothetical protein|uniref:Uncharacterized protein n=1 Tax=Pelatocladus maniniholoensis HA4357-MV3 TaxID=1117104 RepID=A0A9E3H7V5_9NOST|nr:hypothetical protein [Pelatocladus maniniholoensis HA4357-MV3]
MTTITIGFRLFANDEEEAKQAGLPKLKSLWDKVLIVLEPVEKDCLLIHPDLVFEVSSFEADFVSFDETDEKDGKILFDLTYWMEVSTTSPDGIPECDYQFDAYDRWRKMGEPMYQEVFEPLFDCNWTSLEPFCCATGETMGDIVSVEFQAIKAVDSYHGGVHFYSNHRWL